MNEEKKVTKRWFLLIEVIEEREEVHDGSDQFYDSVNVAECVQEAIEDKRGILKVASMRVEDEGGEDVCD